MQPDNPAKTLLDDAGFSLAGEPTPSITRFVCRSGDHAGFEIAFEVTRQGTDLHLIAPAGDETVHVFKFRITSCVEGISRALPMISAISAYRIAARLRMGSALAL
jgi:hypothetical protein